MLTWCVSLQHKPDALAETAAQQYCLYVNSTGAPREIPRILGGISPSCHSALQYQL